MNATYSSISHSILSLVLVAALAGAVSGGLATDPPGPAAAVPARVRTVPQQEVPVLPEITVSASRLPS